MAEKKYFIFSVFFIAESAKRRVRERKLTNGIIRIIKRLEKMNWRTYEYSTVDSKVTRDAHIAPNLGIFHLNYGTCVCVSYSFSRITATMKLFINSNHAVRFCLLCTNLYCVAVGFCK